MGSNRVWWVVCAYRVGEYMIICRDLIVECLDDRDDSIRLRALDLISGMVSKKNLMEIVKKLMLHMDQSESTSEESLHTHSSITYTYVHHQLTLENVEQCGGEPEQAATMAKLHAEIMS